MNNIQYKPTAHHFVVAGTCFVQDGKLKVEFVLDHELTDTAFKDGYVFNMNTQAWCDIDESSIDTDNIITQQLIGLFEQPVIVKETANA